MLQSFLMQSNIMRMQRGDLMNAIKTIMLNISSNQYKAKYVIYNKQTVLNRLAPKYTKISS